MKKLYKAFIFMVLLSVPAMLSGQPYVDLLSIQKNWYNNTTYKNDPNASLDHALTNVSLLLPYVFKNGNKLIFGLDYLENSFRYKSDTSFHTYLEMQTIAAGFIKKWKGTPWTTTFMVLPHIAAALKYAESSDYQLGCMGMLTYKKRNSLKFKFGLYYNPEFYGNNFKPLLGIDWKITDRLYMFGVLPGSMNFEYRLSDRFFTGLAYRNNTFTYHVNNGPKDIYILAGNFDIGNNHLYTFIHAYLTKNLVIYAGAGITLFHYYQLYNDDNEKLTKSNITYKVYNEVRDGAFFQLGAAFRLRLDKDYAESSEKQL